MKQVAAQIQDRMQRTMAPLIRDLKPLKERVQAMTKKRETRSRGEALLAQIEKEERRLGRLVERENWRGNNNPVIQYSRAYGEQRHQQLWSSMSCQVPTSATGFAVFDGGTHKKPDCIIARSGQCEIWEFKPKSETGAREGAEQIADYKNYVPRYYTEQHRKDETPAASKGGGDFLKALRAHCLNASSNQIEFRTVDVKYYDMCEKQYVCEGS